MLVFPFSVFLIATYFSYASADVSLQYPLEDQLPVIARTNNAYSWSFSNESFVSSKNESLDYIATNLPRWLVFDPSTLSFHGTPSEDDVGSDNIKVTAKESSDSASSSFVLRTTDSPPPKMQHSVLEQFHPSNPSLSSVFLVSEKSALRASHTSSGSFLSSDPIPALRIPPKWSFSIGFLYDTFASQADPGKDIYYAALQRDGSPLPPWIDFDSHTITMNGVTPPMSGMAGLSSHLALALHASDEPGYSGASVPFDLFVASHELSLSGSSLPTINITADTPFSISLTSAADFTGVLLDGEPIRPEEIMTMQVDTSFYGEWLKYDTDTRTLSGDPPSEMDSEKGEEPTVLPVTIITTVNQTIQTNVSIAVVPSYFSAGTLQPVLVQDGQSLNFSLTQYFSNATGTGHDDVALSASFDPEDATRFLSFNPSSAFLSGAVPSDFQTSQYSHITITFTAYSHVTHSTSHTSLPLSLTQDDYAHSHNNVNSHPHGPALSPVARQKLIFGLRIAFSVIGGLVALGLILAALRKCARVQDTAMQGEEGERAWTADEKKWYGIGIEVNGEKYSPPESPTSMRSGGSSPSGVPLDRTPTRYGNNSPTSPNGSALLSPGYMRKGDFMGRIRHTARKVSGNTVRVVSDTCRRALNVGSISKQGGGSRLVIGKPTLIMGQDGRRANAESLSYTAGGPRRSRGQTVSGKRPTQDPFNDEGYAASGISGVSGLSVIDDVSGISGSPSSSTGGRSVPSIPRRRPDFAPPILSNASKGSPSSVVLTTPPQAHVSKTHAYAVPLARHRSADSVSSDVDGEIAVVQHAERARSVKSVNGRQASVWSFEGHQHGMGKAAAPRLVPFTSSSRVPMPKAPSSQFAAAAASEDDSVGGNSQAHTKRVASQMARVFRSESTEKRVGHGGKRGNGKKGSADDLTVGIQYVRALGNDAQGATPGSPSPSFSVAESSHMDLAKPPPFPLPVPVPRMLARTNEHFRFRIALALPSTSTSSLDIRLANGEPLARFLRINSNAAGSPRSDKDKDKRFVEFSGIPGSGDVGELNIGVYARGSSECVGKVTLEVVERS